MISICLMGTPSKMIVLNMAKIYIEKMFLISLPKLIAPTMIKPFKKRNLARLP